MQFCNKGRLMRQLNSLLLVVLMLAITPAVSHAQCSNSPTPTATPTQTATQTPTPTAAPTPFPTAWLTVNAGSAWIPGVNNMPGYYGSYFITLNKAPFDVTFTYTFTGMNPSEFTALFPNNAVCITNADGSITITRSHGCPWWIETDEFGVEAFYVATTMVADPGSPYSSPVSH